jgi:hypothetical protein
MLVTEILMMEKEGKTVFFDFLLSQREYPNRKMYGTGTRYKYINSELHAKDCASQFICVG